MKLVSFLKIARINKLNNAESFSDKLLVFACAESSNPRAESNYRVLLKKYNLQEESFEGNKYLLVNDSSDNIASIEKDLDTIENVDILDDEDFLSLKREQKQERQAVLKSLGQCSFCGKTLTQESSLISSMGPVCEHRARQIEEDKVPLSNYSQFKPLGAVSLKKGDSVILKTSQGVGFYEYVHQDQDKLVLIDRKKMNTLNKTQGPIEALNGSTELVPLVDVLGVCSPGNTAEKKKSLWDLWSEDN